MKLNGIEHKQSKESKSPVAVLFRLNTHSNVNAVGDGNSLCELLLSCIQANGATIDYPVGPVSSWPSPTPVMNCWFVKISRKCICKVHFTVRDFVIRAKSGIVGGFGVHPTRPQEIVKYSVAPQRHSSSSYHHVTTSSSPCRRVIVISVPFVSVDRCSILSVLFFCSICFLYIPHFVDTWDS